MPGDVTMDPAGCSAMQIDGLLAWWVLAGVDTPVSEEPVGWLRPPERPPVTGAADSAPTGAARFPGTLSAFQDFLAASADLDESAWPGHRVLPKGPSAPKLMIIVDAPDSAASQTDALFGSDAERLLARITGAVGLHIDDCYVASLSLVAPLAGVMAAPLLGRLAERMRHHIGLVAPTALLLLGDQASRALISTEGTETGKNLPFVNHSDGIVPAASVAHPRVMLGQPSAKAEAWRALQGLAKGWGQ